MGSVAQPSGTVTLVFTDIEGSTRLLAELGEARYLDALSVHREVVRAAFGRSGGYEVDTQGDSFFYAFPSAAGAVTAVGEAMAALEGGPIAVRVGVHTGEPGLDGRTYVGLDVHTAARIMAAGHGGQVVISQSTRDLLDDSFTLLDLGEHRLRDLSGPRRLYQFGEHVFPPLKTLHRTNLPLPATAFIGRERELEELGAVLGDGVRLLTLTGPGGIGKTRLALAAVAGAADAFPDGVWWVPLASLRDPGLVLSSVALAIGVPEQPGRGLEEILIDVLSAGRTILLLDNVEHLLPGAAAVVAMLRGAGGATVVVTSRERLRLSGEQVYRLAPLAATEAAELFSARTAALGVDSGDTDSVVELCRRLDNLPLAVELAAARTTVLSPRQMLERLSRRLDLLRADRGGDHRQETLRSTIEWSHDLLSPAEQRLFAWFAVFAGGCTLDAAEEVCEVDLDALAGLVDKSLIRRNGERYSMLETIRAYAEERHRAIPGEGGLRHRHASFYEHFAAEAEQGMRYSSVARWFDRVEQELPNLRSAMEFSLRDGEPGAAFRISVALERFWQARHQLEGRSWLERVLESAAGTDAERSRAAIAAGTLVYLLGDTTSALALYRDATDRASRAQDAGAHARALGFTAWALAEIGFHKEAVALARECQHLAENVTDPWTRVEALGLVPNTLIISGAPEEADALFREHLARRRELGDELRVCGILNSLGFAALLRGDDDEARAFLEESLDLARAMGDTLRVALALDNMGLVAVCQDRYDEALLYLTEALELCSLRGDRRCGGEVILGLAAAHGALGNLELAAKLNAISTSLFDATGMVIPAVELERLEPHLRKARELTLSASHDFTHRAQTRPLETALAEVDQPASDS